MHVDHFAAWALCEALLRKPDCSISYRYPGAWYQVNSIWYMYRYQTRGVEDRVVEGVEESQVV